MTTHHAPSSRAAEPAITIEGLRVTRGSRRVIDGLDVEIPTGQVTGLLGPSGCGKTTLMRCIVGVQAKVEGTVRVLGRPAGSAGLRHRIGYVTQAASIYDDLTTEENLRFFAQVLGASRRDVHRAASAVDLQDRRDQVVREMSGGQRSRVSLAVALLRHPDLLVLDEPTVGLDPVLRRDLWELFGRLAEDGTTVLVSSHVMDEADRCQRLLLMRDGALVADDTPAALKERTGARDIESAFLEVVR